MYLHICVSTHDTLYAHLYSNAELCVCNHEHIPLYLHNVYSYLHMWAHTYLHTWNSTKTRVHMHIRKHVYTQRTHNVHVQIEPHCFYVLARLAYVVSLFVVVVVLKRTVY